ncbi:uncharacterized protein LOC134227858 [Armigeres subalbatus]|uniref:uncharacterized protein LOC134227858 n=1 Tax=Armigeres subalbatus TaxID=124917 RepID=UPI002ED3CFFE
MAEVPSQVIPSWMIKEYFVDAVAQKLQIDENDVQISGFHVEPATESGDNYASKLYRVAIETSSADGSTKKFKLIVKALADLGLAEEMLQVMNIFPKESAMYSDLLPKFEAMYREKGVDINFGPKCLKHSTKPTDIIVMEDLCDSGFKMANRRQGLDRPHVDLFLKKLAKLHAASAVYHEKNGDYSAQFQKGMYAEESMVLFEAQMQSYMESVIQIIRKHWPNGDFYAEIMNDFGFNMFFEMINVVKADPNGFNVLNHGDAWCNNFLFRYGADNTVEEITMVDFQLSVWSSPAIDLHYFIFTSINPTVRMPQLNSIISFYHRNLVDNLQLLGYSKSIPTLKDLHLDYIDKILYGFSSAFSVLPICLMDKTENASIDTMMSEGEAGHTFREKMYGNPAYVNQLEELLPYFYDNGAFDCRHSGYQKPSGVFSDYLLLPGWMRKEFFGEVVERKLGLERGQFSISKVWVEMATKKGDNYASTMYRAKLDVLNHLTSSLNQFSVIVKCRPTGKVAEFSSKLDPFSKEIEMFMKIIPAFEKLYEDKGLKLKIGPQCLKICKGFPSDIIVMDDLCSQNYKLGNRQDGVDKQHVESVLGKLAEFHAASAVYHERNGNYSNDFKEGLFNRSNLPMMEHMFRPAHEVALEQLKSHSFAKDYIDEMEQLSPVVFSRVLENFVVDPEAFNVLNHGDFWTNNAMFQYDEEEHLQNSTLLDFQVCFYGSPVFDLNYFLYTSVQLDIRLNQLNYFIRYYHEKLVDNLTLLGYGKALPTLKKLQYDFYDRMVYGSYNVLGVMAIMCFDPSDNTSLDLVMQNSEAGRELLNRIYTNERYIKALEILIPHFGERGAFKKEAEVCSFVKKNKCVE